jgi:hypothetical protein
MRFIFVMLSLLLSNAVISNEMPTNLDVQGLALQKSYLQTVDCRSPKQLTSLLKLSVKDTHNLTTKANNAIVLEEIMMNNPDCFIQSLNDLPQQVCEQIEDNYIRETFFYPRNDVKRALSSAKNYRKSCIDG